LVEPSIHDGRSRCRSFLGVAFDAAIPNRSTVSALVRIIVVQNRAEPRLRGHDSGKSKKKSDPGSQPSLTTRSPWSGSSTKRSGSSRQSSQPPGPGVPPQGPWASARHAPQPGSQPQPASPTSRHSPQPGPMRPHPVGDFGDWQLPGAAPGGRYLSPCSGRGKGKQF